MPRSTLFPYTTLFRSTHGQPEEVLCKLLKCVLSERVIRPELRKHLADRGLDVRSEERFSRNAEIYTLSLHDALPIYPRSAGGGALQAAKMRFVRARHTA